MKNFVSTLFLLLVLMPGCDFRAQAAFPVRTLRVVGLQKAGSEMSNPVTEKMRHTRPPGLFKKARLAYGGYRSGDHGLSVAAFASTMGGLISFLLLSVIADVVLGGVFITAGVVGILVGLILGIIALARGQDDQWMAIVAVIVGGIPFALGIVALIIVGIIAIAMAGH